MENWIVETLEKKDGSVKYVQRRVGHGKLVEVTPDEKLAQGREFIFQDVGGIGNQTDRLGRIIVGDAVEIDGKVKLRVSSWGRNYLKRKEEGLKIIAAYVT